MINVTTPSMPCCPGHTKLIKEKPDLGLSEFVDIPTVDMFLTVNTSIFLIQRLSFSLYKDQVENIRESVTSRALFSGSNDRLGRLKTKSSSLVP